VSVDRDAPLTLVVATAADAQLAADIATELEIGLADVGPVHTSVGDQRGGTDGHGTTAAEPDGALAATPLLCIAIAAASSAADAIAAARSHGSMAVLLVSSAASHDDLGPALDAGVLRGVVAWPSTPGTLTAQVRAQLARQLRDTDPDGPSPATLTVAGRGVDLPTSHLLRDLELDEHTVARRLLSAIDGALGPRPRLRLPADVRLTRQGDDVDGVLVVVRGSVALDRSSPLGDLRLHHASTGPVVGLLSLVQQRRAFFTARTTTEAEVVHLTIEQLDLALHRDPEVGAALTATTVRALAGRLRRAEQLQLEKRQLARELEAERQQLATTLAELEATRLDLIEAERLATLGELAAGVAHELNNPVAALVRAASYVRDDVATLLESHPDRGLVDRALSDAVARPPRTTAEQRAVRRTLADATGDATLADRLAAAGVDDPALARAAAEDRTGRRVALLESAHGLAGALRNLEVASGRIAELVDSLRAYARPTTTPVDGVDLAATLEDTLRVVAHRLEGIEVVRRYEAAPTIRGHPGQLGQVWTNLLTNAADATGDGGRITVGVAPHGTGGVEVTVADDGPGMSEDARTRAFEPRFSTKQGTVRYGLGLGLAISKRIVDAHGGTIALLSDERGTTARVVLPVAGPPDGGSGERPTTHDATQTG
jgi:two-component system, NtrC family, sensor kinase